MSEDNPFLTRNKIPLTPITKILNQENIPPPPPPPPLASKHIESDMGARPKTTQHRASVEEDNLLNKARKKLFKKINPSKSSQRIPHSEEELYSPIMNTEYVESNDNSDYSTVDKRLGIQSVSVPNRQHDNPIRSAYPGYADTRDVNQYNKTLRHSHFDFHQQPQPNNYSDLHNLGEHININLSEQHRLDNPNNLTCITTGKRQDHLINFSLAGPKRIPQPLNDVKYSGFLDIPLNHAQQGFANQHNFLNYSNFQAGIDQGHFQSNQGQNLASGGHITSNVKGNPSQNFNPPLKQNKPSYVTMSSTKPISSTIASQDYRSYPYKPQNVQNNYNMSAESMQQQIRPPNYNNSSNSKYNNQIPNYQFMTSQPSTQIAPNLLSQQVQGQLPNMQAPFNNIPLYNPPTSGNFLNSFPGSNITNQPNFPIIPLPNPNVPMWPNMINYNQPQSYNTPFQFQQVQDALPNFDNRGRSEVKYVPRSLTYNGTTSWTTFKNKFLSFLNQSNINDLKTTIFFFTMCFEGNAADYWNYLTQSTHFVDLNHILMLLEQRFDDKILAQSALVQFHGISQAKNENIKDWGDRCWKIAHMAFPNQSTAEIERQVILRFSLALYDKDAAQHLACQEHPTLASAIKSFQIYNFSKKATQKIENTDKNDDTTHTTPNACTLLELTNDKKSSDDIDSIQVVTDRQFRDLSMSNRSNSSQLDYLANWVKNISDKVNRMNSQKLDYKFDKENAQFSPYNRQFSRNNNFGDYKYNSRNNSPSFYKSDRQHFENNSGQNNYQKDKKDNSESFDKNQSKSTDISRNYNDSKIRDRSFSPNSRNYNDSFDRGRSFDRSTNFRRRFDSPRPSFSNNYRSRSMDDRNKNIDSRQISIKESSQESLAKVRLDPKA